MDGEPGGEPGGESTANLAENRRGIGGESGGESYPFTDLSPRQPHFLRERLLGLLGSERQSPAMLFDRAQ